MKRQTKVTYVKQFPVEANIFLFEGDSIYRHGDKTDPL